ncbi:hypothetical protein ERJ75_000572700 [Trypanosoma vivax]|nr:hypothetical protein ERJ75_000572700 [Trypanosoma vivax]
MFLKMQTLFTVSKTYITKVTDETKKLCERLCTLKNSSEPKGEGEAAMETSGDAWNDAKGAADGVKNDLKDLEKFRDEARRETYNYLDHAQSDSNFGGAFSSCESTKIYHRTTEEEMHKKIGIDSKTVGGCANEEAVKWEPKALSTRRLEGTVVKDKYEKFNKE